MGALVPIGIVVAVYVLGHLASDSGPPPKLAIDCPTCGIRPVETARKVGVVRGMIFVFRWGSISLVGCCQCVSQQVRTNLGQNLVLGWWSLFGLFATPFCLLQNIYHLSSRPNSAKLKEVLNEVGVSYQSVLLDDDGMAQGQRDLMQAAAAVLKAVAAVEGTTSVEWDFARQALIALSDGTLTNKTADELMRDVAPFTGSTREGMTEEQRLVLLRVAIDVATADGHISGDEEAVLLDVGEKLGFDRGLIRTLITQLAGGSTDRDVTAARRLLGVSDSAGIGDIRSAYKKLMLKHHPDRVEPKEREEATRISADINAAYDLLVGRTAAETKSSKADTKRPSPGPKPPPEPKSPPKAEPRPPPRSEPQPPPQQRAPVCSACERRVSDTAKFCGFCGTKLNA